MSSLKILIVHNHYQQRGGEDSVFETECAMLRGAGHTVICYEKHNDEIEPGRLVTKGLQNPQNESLISRTTEFTEPTECLTDQSDCLEASNREFHSSTPTPPPFRVLSFFSWRKNNGACTPSAPPSSVLSVPSVVKTPNSAQPPSSPYSLQSKHQQPSLPPFRVFRVFRSALSLFSKTIWNRTTYREITALIQQHHPDIVHCHNTFPLISPSVYWAAAKQGVPVVQTLHNYRLLCINPYLYRNGKICEDCLGRSPIPGIIHRCYRHSLSASFTVATMLIIHRILGTYRNKVTTYIALTEFGRQKFLEGKLCSPEKVVVKPNAVAAPSASESTDLSQSERGLGQSPSGNYALRPTHYALTDGPPTVLYAGRLSSEKGPHLLLEAWKIVLAKYEAPHASSRLIISGDGPERAALEAMAKEIPNVSFTGRLSLSDLHTLMASADVLVLPSTCYETFAMSVNEAAALGTPSIVSDIGGQASIVQDGVTGYTFRSGSAESLAETLAKAMADPDHLAHLSSAARECFYAGDCPPNKNVTALCLTYAHVCPPSGHTHVKFPPACGH